VDALGIKGKGEGLGFGWGGHAHCAKFVRRKRRILSVRDRRLRRLTDGWAASGTKEIKRLEIVTEGLLVVIDKGDGWASVCYRKYKSGSKSDTVGVAYV